MFCKSPTVAALLGLEFVKSIKPSLPTVAGLSTDVTLSFGFPLGATSVALYHLPSLANTLLSTGANVFAPFATLPNCVGVVVWLFGAPAVLATFGFTKLDCNGLAVVSIGSITVPSFVTGFPSAFVPTAGLPSAVIG